MAFRNVDIGCKLNECNRMYWLRRHIFLVILVLMLPWGAYFHAAKSSQLVGSFVVAPETSAFGAQSRITAEAVFSDPPRKRCRTATLPGSSCFGDAAFSQDAPRPPANRLGAAPKFETAAVPEGRAVEPGTDPSRAV